MKRKIDMEAILAPIAGGNPAGDDLRYTPVYDNIKEARREDEFIDPSAAERDIKRAEWDKVLQICTDALSNKTKDIQIAAWLTEALIMTEGFEGLAAGLKIINTFLTQYWDSVYPAIEDGDLDFRSGPIEFMNDKLSLSIKQVPVTDIKDTPGYSWYQWQESQLVGYETGTRNQYGDVDEGKKQRRDELIAEGKLTAEDFDIAAQRTSKAYYNALTETLNTCHEEFRTFDAALDEKFGPNAPRVAEIREAIEACEMLASRLLSKKREVEPDPAPLPQAEEAEVPQYEETERGEGEMQPLPQTAAGPLPAIRISDTGSIEKALWEDSLKKLKEGGIKKALDQLYAAACSMPSVREQNRYRLLMTKLCLRAERPDLARPIVEQLHALIEELHLDRWESPMWIAEVLEALYQCLTAGEPSEDDMARARELFRKICTLDVTKALIYKT
ncbi:MAG: type VI secretion system protein TssA [Nitrospirota bacterium]